MQYEDFILQVRQNDKTASDETRALHVSVLESPAGEVSAQVAVQQRAPEFDTFGNDSFRTIRCWQELVPFGECLGRLAFPDAVRALLVRSLDLAAERQRGLRIRLRVDEALAPIPWEYALVNRSGGESTLADFLVLDLNISLVRHQTATLTAPRAALQIPAQVLVALNSPGTFPALDLDDERIAIENALHNNPRLTAAIVENGTPEAVFWRTRRADIFHFAGHGDVARDATGLIYLDDGGGFEAPVRASELAVQLRRLGVRAAVLNACHSGQRESSRIWNSVGLALLQTGLAAVVAMQNEISDSAAGIFARQFYAALAAGASLDEAVSYARLAIAQQNVLEWGTPVLYLRAPDGVLFPEFAENRALDPERRALRLAANQNIGALRGRAVAVQADGMSEGAIHAAQTIERVQAGGHATAAEVRTMTGGEIDATQNIGSVAADGTVIGVSVEQIGRT